MTVKRLPLKSIHVHGQYQFRESAFAQDTVDAIMAEGFVAAKFDPLPVFRLQGKWYIGGDGHSRYAALNALKAAGQFIPPTIPVRVVGMNDILRLAYTANMSRTPFTPCEEAAIFKRRQDAGESLDDIARTSNRTGPYVRDRLLLNLLAPTLRPLVGKAEYGMTVGTAIAFAKSCAKYNIDHGQQQALWKSVVSQGDFTPKMLEIALKGMAGAVTERSSEGMMFEMPANVGAIASGLNDAGNQIMAACRALRAVQRYAVLFSPALREGIKLFAADDVARLERLLENKYKMLGKGRAKRVDRSGITRTGQLDNALKMLEGCAA